MVVCKSVIHHVVKLDCCSVSFSSPPKPLTTCLVQRSPQDGYLTALQLLQLDCNRIKISDSCIVLSGVLHYCFSHIKISVVCVEGASSRISSQGREPMPEENYNTFSLSFIEVPADGFGCGSIIVRLKVVPRIVRRVVLHVKASNYGFQASFGDKVIIVKGGLS